MNFATFLKMKREEKELTLEALARLCDVSTMTLWKLESGKTLTPSVKTIEKIAKALGVAPESIFKTKKDI